MQDRISVTEFGGLNKNSQTINVKENEYPVMSNFTGTPNYNSPSLQGIITRIPSASNYKTTMPAAGRARGLFYAPCGTSVNPAWLFASQLTTDPPGGGATFGDQTIYVLDIASNTWYTKDSTVVYPIFNDYVYYNDKVYMTNGSHGVGPSTYLEPITKMGTYPNTIITTYWPSFIRIKDKYYDETDITTAYTTLTGTATFTAGSAAVVGAGTNFDPEVSAGDWIVMKLDDGPPIVYSEAYEVRNVTDDTHLTLMTTVATADAGNGKAIYSAPDVSFLPRYIIEFKDRMFSLNELFYPNRLRWSAIGEMERWTGDETGFLDIFPNESGFGAGLGKLEDYLFIFKDYAYYVYSSVDDVDLPIQMLNKFPYRCCSFKTIQNVENYIVYFTGTDVRATNGSADISIANDKVKNYLYSYGSKGRVAFEQMNATSNQMPWALVDETKNQYILSLPTGTSTAPKTLIYDYVRKIWIGEDNVNDMGDGVIVEDYTSQYPTIVYASADSSNQIKQLSSTIGDFTNSGYIESKTFSAGKGKQLQIYFIEFTIDKGGTAGSLDTNITFNYKKNFGALDSSKEQTTRVTYATTGDNSNITLRFLVNQTCDYFSWYLKDTPVTGTPSTRSWSIVDWTMAYELKETT